MFDRCLYFNLNALTRLVNKKWADVFTQFDLSPAHGYMLRVILSMPGISQKELALELNLEKSTVTRFIDVLEKKNLAMRESGTKDGRKHHIHPTLKAKELQSSLEQTGDELYQAMVSLMGEKELVTLVSKLRKSANMLR